MKGSKLTGTEKEEKAIRILVIGGPTGVGKSKTAVRVAEKLSGEIISADSVQVFRHFDIGSGKPPLEMRESVPHHLIDCIEPNEVFSLWDFKEAAHKAIADIVSRGKVPILTGGTGLYIRAVIENLQGGVSADPELRRSLLEMKNTDGASSLYERLIRLDPNRSAKIHPNDTHRIIRGLENAILAQEKKTDSGNAPKYDAAFFILGGRREEIYQRINERVIKMFAKGWIKETEDILNLGFNGECKPFHTVGYKQIMEFIREGASMDDLIEEVQKQTRRYAKRQITWFNSVENAIWIDFIQANADLEGTADFMAYYFNRSK